MTYPSAATVSPVNDGSSVGSRTPLMMNVPARVSASAGRRRRARRHQNAVILICPLFRYSASKSVVIRNPLRTKMIQLPDTRRPHCSQRGSATAATANARSPSRPGRYDLVAPGSAWPGTADTFEVIACPLLSVVNIVQLQDVLSRMNHIFFLFHSYSFPLRYMTPLRVI